MQEFKQQYYEGRERMNPSIEDKLKTNSTELSLNPAFPKYDKNGVEYNFEELIAYKRFLDCVKKVKHYTKIDDISGQNGFMKIQSALMDAIHKVSSIESNHREELERLGVDLVTQEMEIPDNTIEFNAKIVGLGNVKSAKFEYESKEPSEQEIDSVFNSEEFSYNNDLTGKEKFDLEKNKRRFINLLIHGASKKGHYMFELIREDLNKINPELSNLYGIIMSVNDLTYWLMPDETINLYSRNASSKAGSEEIDNSQEIPKVKTEAINFPTSVHENIKGVMEIFGTHGLPDDTKAQDIIMNSTDTLPNETWDIRLGVGVWEKFLRAYPIEVFEEGNKNIQHYLFVRFCSLEAEEMFDVARMILSDDPKGAKYIQRMVEDILNDFKKDDLNDTLGSYDFGDDDDKYAKGGNVSSIDKKVKEINNLIELANTNNISVVDTSGTWQSPMKYKPIKYSNGVLYIEYDELDLYSQNKKGTSDWKTVKEKVLKRDMEFDNPLNNIAKMYRKALKEEGIQFEEGGNVSDELNYINRRIKNLEDLLPQMNEDEKDEIEQTIKDLKSEKEKIQKKGSTQDLKPKKSFWLFKKGGDTGNIKYDIIPSSDSFIIIEVRKYEDSEEKNTIKDLKGKDLLFEDIKSAQNFIDNKINKFPYGIPKANAGMMLLASQLLQPQQSQPQVVYYVPQTQEQSSDTGIIQNIPKMEFGGEFNQTDMNDFCISQLIALANDLQPVRYYTTDRYSSKDANFNKYKGKLVIVFKEPIRLIVLHALSEFIEKAVDCHDIFEQEVDVNGSQTSSVSFYLLTNEFADVEYKKGGRVYDFPPKKIDVSKTKKITTELGDYNLAVITNDSIYFVNPKEGDDNAQTIMYNKKGELLSDNVLATNDLYDKLLEEETFEFIHPDIEAYRQEIISEN